MPAVPVVLAGASLILAVPGAGPAEAVPTRAVLAKAPALRLVSTSMSPMASTNGKVSALVYANGRVYVGGAFSRMTFRRTRYFRPNLGAVNAATGRPTSFRPGINGMVRSLALSPDGSVLYVGGLFDRVGHAFRNSVAAFSTTTGQLLSFNPKVAGIVLAIAATSSGVYLGGTITKVDGHRRTYAAEVSLTGGLTRWKPRIDGYVRAMLISPDGTRIILGGGFHHVNRRAHEAIDAVNLTSGASEPFTRNLIKVYIRRGHVSQVTSFTSDGRLVYAGAEGTGKGVFDGTMAFRPDSGKLVWRNRCLGATQGVLYLRGVLYKASHAHDCHKSGGFGQIKVGWQAHHLMAESAATGALLNWGTTAESLPFPMPNTNGGIANQLGPYCFATDGTQLFVGGEFTKVNGRRQEGLARFGP